LGKAGLSNGHGGGFSSSEGYGRFSEDFLNRTFQFHNPFDIFEQFMSHFGADDDFGKLIINSFQARLSVDIRARCIFHAGENTRRIKLLMSLESCLHCA
jgi:hypothetical protein